MKSKAGTDDADVTSPILKRSEVNYGFVNIFTYNLASVIKEFQYWCHIYLRLRKKAPNDTAK